MDFGMWAISFIQGVGELLPVSSSVNMFLAQKLLRLDCFNFHLKIALHVGSLFALLFYFRKNISDIIVAIFTSKKKIKETYLLHLFIGTVPVMVLGYLSMDFIAEFNNHTIMGISCIFFGLLLYFIDKFSIEAKKNDKKKEVSIYQAFFVGLFQTIAIFPGVSRLGICITACRMMSFNRTTAIFFSIFLAIPSILGSLCIELLHAQNVFSKGYTMGMLATAAISVVVMYPCVKFMEKKGFLAIAIYRCIIGAAIWKLDYLMRVF
jgi:undecaprenyl-diphosphatase